MALEIKQKDMIEYYNVLKNKNLDSNKLQMLLYDKADTVMRVHGGDKYNYNINSNISQQQKQPQKQKPRSKYQETVIVYEDDHIEGEDEGEGVIDTETKEMGDNYKNQKRTNEGPTAN